MSKSHFAIYLVQLLLVVGPSDADRIKDTMYMKISGSVACYRRMNATHQIGCSSARGGSVGVVHYCDSATDLDFILKNGSAGPYIPVLPISLLSAETVSKLSSSKVKISGLLLHANSENLLQMSHENQCPNDIFNVQQAPKTCPDSGGWNPWGTGLLYADVPFPMFYMHNDSEVSAIRHCFQAFNNHSFATQAARSLCSLELNAFMYGTTNTQTCIRRSNVVTNLNPVKFCDPLGDSNVWGALFPLVTGEENDSQPIRDAKYIVVAARLDTTSLFEETAGAESPITGAVALLTVAKLLKEMLPAAAASVQTNVLFILFNGETYDYIGSQRLLYDMERGHFPTDLPPNNPILPTIYPENVTLFIELSQLGVGEATYAHYLSADAWLGKFAANLTRNNPSTVVPLKPTPDSLPPSSLHTFIRGNTSIRGLVLANHQTAYQNRFYNSLFDNSSNIGYRYYNGSEIGAGTLQRHIADVATMVAKSVFEECLPAMAETVPALFEQELLGVKELLWGAEIKQDIFQRWSQGFYFSSSEKSALEQAKGGPCAIIAPVQAFIVKNLLLEYKGFHFRDRVTSEVQSRILVRALCEILSQVSNRHFCVVHIDESGAKREGDRNKNLSDSQDINAVQFHEDLRVIMFVTLGQVTKYYLDHIAALQGKFGVLLFLYSVILSRRVKSECFDLQEPLIDETYGYGSQALINLMISGRATMYVWDHFQEIAGLTLMGIEKQSQVGFITIMEYHRLCTVGSFYKNPIHPVWVLASDTHLTVLFSDERQLVSLETKSEQARRIFKRFDPEENNFISSDKLRDVLQALNLVNELEYVNIMKKKLDSECLGIILLSAFMDEFFPKEESSTPDLFTLFHYNGLAQSHVNGQIQYHIGSAILLESDIKSVCESNAMLTVLQTKWPNIEVNWCDGATPSLN
ncbi:hypothetical protein HUJ04_001115 [Dendroctonus ponderosae]|nr:hypothetical protein HUJ04_001115 [Dendroctonus ponderosae]